MRSSTIFFSLAVLHTLCASLVGRVAHRFRPDSMGENLFHYLGEVEIIFGFWAFLFLGFLSIMEGMDAAVAHLQGVAFTEPAFVFVVMCMASTKPVMDFARMVIGAVVRVLCRLVHIQEALAFYVSALFLGPLLGSLITEPAAMTVVALLLRDTVFAGERRLRLKYATLGLLFVNVSIGGVLTSFAAPPVVMVAKKWGLTNGFMFQTFGLRAIGATLVSTLALAWFLRKDIAASSRDGATGNGPFPASSPKWMMAIHLGFLVPVILYHSVMAFFLPLFFLFLGWTMVSKEYQEPLRIRESLLVGFFLGGLVTLGGLQAWWLQPLLARLGEDALFFGTAGLTAVTDNAALTYLGSLVPSLSTRAQYALLAGAVTGGGLTVIANAPNPAGFGILNERFGEGGIAAGRLLGAALFPTAVAMVAFWLVP